MNTKPDNPSDSARSPFFSEDGSPLVRLAVCVFADLLGTKARTQKCTDVGASNALCRTLHGAFHAQNEELKQTDVEELSSIRFDKQYEHHIFSDSLILGYPIPISRDCGEPQLGEVIYRVTRYQMCMVLRSFPLRGAVSIGELHMSEGLVFGKALVEAAELGDGQERLPYPCVVLTPRLRKVVELHADYYSPPGWSPQARNVLMCRPADGDKFWFLNYLDAANYAHGSDVGMLEKHREFVQENLNESRGESTHEKYQWLREYHNYFCDNFVTADPDVEFANDGHVDFSHLRITSCDGYQVEFKRIRPCPEPSGIPGKVRLPVPQNWHAFMKACGISPEDAKLL